MYYSPHPNYESRGRERIEEEVKSSLFNMFRVQRLIRFRVCNASARERRPRREVNGWTSFDVAIVQLLHVLDRHRS
jgi:hypothetical protein